MRSRPPDHNICRQYQQKEGPAGWRDPLFAYFADEWICILQLNRFIARSMPSEIRTLAASPAAAFGVGLWLDISQVPLRENNPTAAVVERFRRDFPQGIVDAFEAEGFIWGGKWHDYEFGYFEYQGRRID